MLVKFGNATCGGAAKANPVPAKHIRTNAAAIRLARFSMVSSSVDNQSQPGNANGARTNPLRRTRKENHNRVRMRARKPRAWPAITGNQC
jgi:ribonuclease PH